MESVDQQLRQLKENYEHMTEDELCAVAENAYDLTEIAREALQTVITERGFTVRLKLEPPAPSSAEPPDDEDLVIFTWPRSIEEAGRTMAALAAAGIPSFLNLEVRADDVKRAQAALSGAEDDDEQEEHKDEQEEHEDEQEEHEDEQEEHEEKKDYAILCPKCRSAAVVLKGRDTDLANPPPTAKFQWSCDSCGHQWVDEGIEQEVAGGQSWPGEEFPSPSEEWDPK